MDYVIKDKRFAHVAKDARFRKMPVGERKVKIDKRFKGMFNDKRFKLKYSVDKRGKPMNMTTNENLQKYYELSDEDNSDSENESLDKRVANDSEDSDNDIAVVGNAKKTNKSGKKGKATDKRFQVTHVENESAESDQGADVVKRSKNTGKKSVAKSLTGQKNDNKTRTSGKLMKRNGKKETEVENTAKIDSDSVEDTFSEDDDDGFDEETVVGHDRGLDYARGEGNVVSSSSSEDDTESDDDEDDQQDDSKFDHGWGDGDTNIIALDEATYRLAVCNMDWDRMKAKDIFVLLNSFKPSNGLIKSVTVYPSEYGKERIAEETTHGPRELKEMTIDEDGVAETVEGTSYHREKLREYQLNRLKYFYAIVVFDSAQTADVVYKECDGLEYESSATKLDLRFIPDEEKFEDSEVKSVCTEIPNNYKPQYFLNAALTQTKVELTWDETDHERVNLTSQHFNGKGEEIEDEDLKAYLASSSDEEGPNYSALLGAGADDDDDSGEDSDEDKKINKYKQLLTDIESEEKKKKRDVEMEISWEPGLREATENLVKKKKEGKNKTVWEDYLERKKEKKRQKMEERKKEKKDRKVTDSGSESDPDNIQLKGTDTLQAFSDDEVPVDEDMAAFMAEEADSSKKKKNKKNKKKKKKAGLEETPETAKEKAELSLLMMDEENKKHFNLRDLVNEDGKKKKKKKEQKKITLEEEEDFKINVEDPRFSAVFDSHLYNIDPSAPEYRKTKGTEAIVSEKIKRSSRKDKQKRSHPGGSGQTVKKQKLNENQHKKDESLATLIKSVKSKTAHFHGNKSKR